MGTPTPHRGFDPARRFAWWGGRIHAIYTVLVFVMLASIDNAAMALYPVLLRLMAIDFEVSEGKMGLAMGVVILVTALTAVGWGYWGDRSSRKRLLFWGTLIWSGGLAMAGLSSSFGEFIAWTAVFGVGLGSVASIGFSVISDFISPRRRGLAMSFWGLSQGVGGILGLVSAALLGNEFWRLPFYFLATAGVAMAVLYLTTFDAMRGRSEPEVAALVDAGETYDYQIEPSDIPQLFRVRTNVWLIVQGFSAQLAYGSLIWVPLLYQAKVASLGYDLKTSIAVGAFFGGIVQIGGIASIASGALGDRLQRRNPRARALISSIGILGGIPFFIAFFFVPLTGLVLPEGASGLELARATLASVVTNPYVGAGFLLALFAVTFTSADSPNWFALISDVNLPEHRGTVFGLGNLSNGLGRASGTVLIGFAATSLERQYSVPTNLIVGLALFQLFFIPAGFCYWRASKHCEGDINRVHRVLRERTALKIGAE